MIILVSGQNDDHCLIGLKEVLSKVQELEATIQNLLPKEEIEDKNDTAIKGVFEGSITKADPNLVLPTNVQINWFNFIENPKTSPYDKTKLWRMLTTTSSVVTNNGFKIELDTTVEEMNRNITLISDQFEGILEDGVDLTDYRLAMGIISGHYDGVVQENIYDRNFYQNLIQGPNNEMALADIYAIFYKYDIGRTEFWKKYDFPDCYWVNQIPDGFSCAKATNFEECNRRGRNLNGFVQIPCNQMVLKVTKNLCIPNAKIWNMPQCLVDFKYV